MHLFHPVDPVIRRQYNKASYKIYHTHKTMQFLTDVADSANLQKRLVKESLQARVRTVKSFYLNDSTRLFFR